MQFQISEILSIIAIIISILFAIITFILNRREKPNLMPDKHAVYDDNLLTLDFLNTSEINIHEPSILINAFDNELKTIKGFPTEDKFLFNIGSKTVFNYRFPVDKYARNNFFLRIRIKGFYYSKFPLFAKRKFEQILWYSGIPISINENHIKASLTSSHRIEIDQIKQVQQKYLEECEQHIDNKYKLIPYNKT